MSTKRRAFIAASATGFGVAALGHTPASGATPPLAPSLAQSVVRLPLQKGITPDVAVDCMKLRANMRNMKQVGYLPLSQQVTDMLGTKQRRTEVFLFCNPITAMAMVDSDIDFGAYLPCRITLTQDAKGQYWLVMLNLTPLIAQIPADSPLRPKAEAVNDILMSIIHAGAAGDL
jgi:uncharacterized protein (DUF302 family)